MMHMVLSGLILAVAAFGAIGLLGIAGIGIFALVLWLRFMN